MSPKIVDRDTRRTEILDAAVRVFARQGYHATKVEDVARQAGIANGTVYLYFDSRDEILVAAFDRFADDALTAVRAALEMPMPAYERLRSVVRALLANTEAEPDLARLMLDFWATRTSEGKHTPIDVGAIYAEYRELIGDLLDQAGREGGIRSDLPADTPAVIVGVIEGTILQWIVDPDAVSPRETSDALLDVVLTGLRERSTT